MRTKVTDDFRGAVKKWLEIKGYSARKAGKIVGCSHQTITNIKDGLTDSINDDTAMALEPHINFYRDNKDFQGYVSEGIKKVGGYNPDLWKWDTEIIGSIKDYKNENNLSYEQLSKKYNFPLIKLVTYLEKEYDGEFFEVAPEDVPAFAAMCFQMISEEFNKNK